MKNLFIILIAFLSVNAYTQTYSLQDFYTYNATLAQKTDSIFATLNDTSRVGQMIVPAAGQHGKSDAHVLSLIQKQYIGGVLLLNGTTETFKNKITKFNSSNKGLPLIYSADAEPSLVNRKIEGTQTVKNTNKMLSREEVLKYAEMICEDLKSIGINYNYAPVVDMSPNKVVSFRSFGNNADTAQVWANIFIKETQKHGIVATAKHFPGHGYVVGDSHEQLVYIDGELKEIENYIPLINNGVISVMVGHIAVKNNLVYNTNKMPSTCSRKIVTDLLKHTMKFNGIVVTDAMNMGGVSAIPNCELKAVQAGCDMILMPVDEEKALFDIVNTLQSQPLLKQQVYASVKKIIRLKICLGIL